MKPELLAPAGDIEAGYAALYYGADAVYLGLKNFSARATATNFDDKELNNFVGYAHHLKRKVYVTINTLVQETELPTLLDCLNICSDCEVDGIIIQDLGVARIIKNSYPKLELHASTQMAVHNKQGAVALQQLGFKRVVLARELSINEIKEIASIPNLETEIFIHGALCYSYSGLCFFSSLENGRSANRGKCLYPCRSIFTGKGGNKHYFSMKDLSLQDDILKLPVTSLKIEGRKKNALYVAAVADYYRKILDGEGAQPAKAEHIKQIFSRPWCKFMLHGKDKNVIDRDFVGHRGLLIGKVAQVANGRLIFRPSHKISRHDGLQIDVAGQEKPFGFSIQNMSVEGKKVYEAPAGQEVIINLPPKANNLVKGQNIYLASSSEVKGSYNYTRPKEGEYIHRRLIDVTVNISDNELQAVCGDFYSSIPGHFEPANDTSKTANAVSKAFSKTGDTEFTLRNIIINNPQNLFVPVSLLNELRRSLYEKVHFEGKKGVLPQICVHHIATQSQFIIRTDSIDNLALINLNEVAEVEVLLRQDTDIKIIHSIPRNKLRLVLPPISRNVSGWEKIMDNLLSQGYKKWTIGNWWGLTLLPRKGIDLAFDSTIYMMNTQAIAMAMEIGANRVCLSPEDTMNNMLNLVQTTPLPIVFPIYCDVPLFSSAVCIRDNSCSQCHKGTCWLELNQDHKIYQVLSQDCQTMVFNANPLCFAKEAPQIKADFYRVDFCYKNYSPEQVAQIFGLISSYKDVIQCNKGNIHNLTI